MVPAKGGEQEQAGAERGAVLVGAAQVRFLCAGASIACSRIAPEKTFFSFLLWLWRQIAPFSYSAQNPKGAGLTVNKFPWQFDLNGQDL